jgi:hypothetical protein
MTAAAFTPRVRILVVCDEIVASEIEEGVFTLEGVRQGFSAGSFPCNRALGIYLLLSYPRRGHFDGQVKLVQETEERTIRFTKFTAAFDDHSGFHALVVEMGDCVFPEPGVYKVAVEFWVATGNVLKAEQPFHVWQVEE